MAAGGRLPSSNAVDQQNAITHLLGEHADTYDKASLQFVLYGDKTPTFVRSIAQEIVDMRATGIREIFPWQPDRGTNGTEYGQTPQ